MKRFGRLIAVALLAMSSASVVAAPAQAASPAKPSPTVVRHYADALTVTAQGADQCSVTTKSRKGAWACPKEGTVRPQSTTGTCSAIGCWEFVSTYHAEFSGDGVYGYGGTILGNVSFWVEDKFSGGASTSYPFQFESTRGTKTVAASGERLYFSTAHPEGNLECCFQSWNGGPYGSYTLINCFGFTGYKATQTTDAWAGIAHQWQWTDPSTAYPGTWWIWVKSPKWQRQASGQYTITNPPQMGVNWYGSGHDA